MSRKFISDQVAAELKNPTTFTPDLDQLAAYRLLIHAELEDFLEAKAKERISEIEKSIISKVEWVRQYPGLIALAITLEKAFPKIDLQDRDQFMSYTKSILDAARKRIKENNGIKANSFLFLSLCAGKANDEVDSFLSGSLNSYGKDRGDVAHQSVTHSKSLQAPSAELNSVNSLVQQISAYYDVCS